VMQRDHGEIIAARLAEMMNVAPATVTMTLKRMERDQWITGKARSSIQLTETGRAAANSVIRRHMLTEWLLVSIFKLPIYETHNEAHNIEHAISPRLEARMQEILQDPKLCPHGNPFPGFEHLTKNWVSLIELSPGEIVIIRRIHEFIEDEPELLAYLQKYDIVPGVRARMTQNLPFNQTVSLSVNDQEVTLGYHAAGNIFAERKSGGE